MGKILIIKGADFTQNGISIDVQSSIEIGGNITLTKGYDISGNSSSGSYLANVDKYDLTQYIAQGFNHIRSTMLITNQQQCLELSNLDGSSYVRPENNYVGTVIESPIDISKPYLRLSTKRTGSYASQTYQADAIVKIEVFHSES